MANYTDLKNDIVLWLADTDLVPYVPTFIRLCETKINREMETLVQETTVSAPVELGQTPEGTNYITLPCDFERMVTITSPNTPEDTPLDYVSPDRMVNEDQPYFYSIKGNYIMLPTGVEGVVMTYIAQFPELTDAAPSNWLTSHAYDVLLYGSLSHAEGFLVNDARIAVWDAAFVTGMQTINDEADRARTSGNTLRVI